jgi:hypothetical protein
LLALYQLDTGEVHYKQEIDEAIRTNNPYQTLGYHVDENAHGTCVADIAAGNGRGKTRSSGIAPNSHIVCIDLGDSPDTVGIVRAVKWLFEHPNWKHLPIVANVSFCKNTGPHDGSTLVEIALDSLLIGHKNRAITLSAGNYRDKGWHTHGVATRLSPSVVSWQLPKQPATIELWYPSGASTPTFNLRQQGSTTQRGYTVGNPNWRMEEKNRFEFKHEKWPLNSKNVLTLHFNDLNASEATWELEISTNGTDVLYHAWIEHNANQVRFNYPTTACTLGLAK